MYVLVTNQTVKKYPYSTDDLKKDNPNTSFPINLSNELLASYSVFPVVSTGTQYNTTTQVAKQSGCLFNTDKNRWETAWIVRDKTTEEFAKDQQILQNNIVIGVQQRLDSFAMTRNYDSILSACTYATSSVFKFKTEGQYCVEARDSTWAKLYEILAEVQAGTRPVPTGYDDIEGDLPVLEWPTI